MVSSASDSTIDTIKPRLRGWIHACTAPLAFASCLVLVILAPTTSLTIACVIYSVCTLLLFGNSGIYHLGNGHWGIRVAAILRRIDHANIFLLIAGTYTPLCLALLAPATAKSVLCIVWGGALAGIFARLFWMSAPRWLYTPLYIILGWVAVWFLPDFWQAGGPAVVALIASGGVIYTLGALVYAMKKPDLFPRWFGFHEIFHVCTVLAWIVQCIACYLAVL
ncbi:PAQR family membrane homeostasis protein TrhA [Actinomyces vulturis]|uniref:PAQR family membrane homeostasis protein TrhA n=1 Tax=Actinomyces vulturis TaxID=1857645 RepID=UPI003CCBBA7F